MKKIYDTLSVTSSDDLIDEINQALIKYPKGFKINPKNPPSKGTDCIFIPITIMVTDKEYQEVKELEKLRETHIIYDNGLNSDGTKKYFLVKK